MNFSQRFWRSLLFIMLISALCGGLAMPLLAPARAAPQMENALDVIINEVAWGGTAAANADEWIELYNPTLTSIDLSGWTITAADGNPTPITIPSGSIPAGGYFLLERVEKAVDIPADYVYGGANLGNGNPGETLVLRDAILPTPNIIDTANLAGGAWPGGSGGPNHATMERISVVADSPTAWASNNGIVRNGLDSSTPTPLPINGTPKQINSATLALTPTVTTTPPTATFTSTATFTPITPTTTFTPATSTPVGFLSVLINEVAWMGTAASTSDEWIELYNPAPTSSTPINLAGWVLKAADGTPTIALTGSLSGGGYFLLERTDNDAVIDAVANQIFTGDLGNSNETLQLFDPSNRLVDTANANGGNWPAGSSTTFGSMERRGVVADSDTAWITNVQSSTWMRHDSRGTGSTNYLIHGTPGYGNWAFTVTATASPTPSRTRTPLRPTPTRTLSPPPPPPLVAINEFVPRPGHDWNNDGVVNVEDEYVELINHGTINVNLSGYSLDDEVNIGSNPFQLPAITISPGERIVFYGSDTGLLLSDGGDGVRLLRPNGQLMDAYNYRVVRFPDQSYCRLPDNGGLDDWNTNCFPTPGLQNALSGSSESPPNVVEIDLLCPIADTLPLDFILAECPPFGNNIWRAAYWDDEGWYGEKNLPRSPGKWPVFAD